jgi:uracil-DNA glycosylase family 4
MPHHSPSLTPAEAEALLRWYVDMGVDVALEDEPQDRFATAMVLSPQPVDPQQVHTQPMATAPQSQTVQAAVDMAAASSTLDELRAAMEAFEGCALKRTATQLVFADGTPGSRLMLIGEAPGRDEDREGRPFVGRAGQLLTRMLAAIGLARTDVYIANVIPWRPPGNRTPTPQEAQTCLPFLHRQIELAEPEMLVLLGGAAASALTGSKEGVLKMRGRWFEVQTPNRTIPALVTLHPAYLLRSPLQKRLAWRDLCALWERLEGVKS